ncbi:MAG: hypothetical protein PHH05_08390 [Syntrophaceticus sp.]|nr:hypothetical protein [Syntrophaceticus sp.]
MQNGLELEIVVTEEILNKRTGGRSNETLAKYLPEVISLGESLLEPKIVYDVFAIDRVEEKKLYLENGEVFQSEHLCKLVSGADKLMVMCSTIGPALESKVKELGNNGDMLKQYLLDIYGASAAGILMDSLYKTIVKDYTDTGYGVTVQLQPGQLDWNVSAQQVVFRLLSPEKIGVTLNDGNMMTPVKSTTGVFGIGDVEKVKEGHLACKVCPKRDSCSFRREAEAVMQGHF